MKWIVAVALLLVDPVALRSVNRRPLYQDTTVNYEEVLPQITRTAHPGQLYISIPTKRWNYSLILELASPKVGHSRYFTTNRQEVMKKNHMNCFYQGWVEGHPDWRASISTCHGLQGFFGHPRDDNHLFQIEPLILEGDRLVEKPHAFYIYKHKRRNHDSHQSSAPSVDEHFSFEEQKIKRYGHIRFRRQSPTPTDTAESESPQRESHSAALAAVASVIGVILFLLFVVAVIIFFITLSIRRSLPRETFKPHYTVQRAGVRHASSVTHTSLDSLDDVILKKTEMKDDVAITVPIATSSPIVSASADIATASHKEDKLVPVRTAPQRPPVREPPPLPVIQPPSLDTEGQLSLSESHPTPPPVAPPPSLLNGVSAMCDDEASSYAPSDSQTSVQKPPLVTKMKPLTPTKPATTDESSDVEMLIKAMEALNEHSKSTQKEGDRIQPQLRPVPVAQPNAKTKPSVPIKPSKPTIAPKPAPAVNVPAPKPKPKPKPLVTAEKPVVKPAPAVPPSKPVGVPPKPAVKPVALDVQTRQSKPKPTPKPVAAPRSVTSAVPHSISESQKPAIKPLTAKKPTPHPRK